MFLFKKKRYAKDLDIGGPLFTYWAAFDAIQDEIRRVSAKEEKRRSKSKK